MGQGRNICSRLCDFQITQILSPSLAYTSDGRECQRTMTSGARQSSDVHSVVKVARSCGCFPFYIGLKFHDNLMMYLGPSHKSEVMSCCWPLDAIPRLLSNQHMLLYFTRFA